MQAREVLLVTPKLRWLTSILIVVGIALFLFNLVNSTIVANFSNRTIQTSDIIKTQAPAYYQNEISFSSYNWTVRLQNNSYPGPNNWSSSTENVWVDGNGWVHMKITNRNGTWYCPEIALNEKLGYGTYTFHTRTRVDNLDKNVVLGLFIYQDNDHEIDIEYSRWGNEEFTNTAFTVQPAPLYENINTLSFETTLSQIDSTHLFVWNTTNVLFENVQGNYTMATAPQQNIIRQFYSNESCASTGERAIINLWLYKSQPPSNGQPVEVIVTAFDFTPLP